MAKSSAIKSNGASARRFRFKRLAPQRTQRAIERIEQVKKCAARSLYAYHATEAKQIVGALRKAVDELERAFFPPIVEPQLGFVLREVEDFDDGTQGELGDGGPFA